MPEIRRFLGIVIKMLHGHHDPPHFHAEYGERRAVVAIGNLAVLAGDMPPRATSLVIEWAALHRTELAALWRLARDHQPLHRIAPLE